jgi:nucleotide-binding universal stress UspA family protein
LKEDAEMFKRILVPLDGSEIAEKALPVVIAEAQCHNATVVMMRVVVPFRSLLMMSPARLETANQQVEKIVADYLETVADQLRSEGLEVETIIEWGPPAQKIVEFAESGGCDLIIIGSRGETGALRWRFGSVANKVVKTKLAVPVMIVTTKP